ncbi:cell cycle regulatory protein [Pseudovirgaria hyperparasitica]|uniref:Cell cycle regulatory protein n=1 Tax=Pseudovirgaria hyperparasitica TaxID=470096 RepID=A0A6A6W092_9PEZI|nr:cell cycle regulatory protein [Pseudovirgaria hyperparasitica]KAF2756322.1 cell cycle regulatory protein [Pseudovirgaria hyperparasitica]
MTSQSYAKEIRTPPLLSPPESKTPPTAHHKRHSDGPDLRANDRSSIPVDPSALSRALEVMKKTGRERERTPEASPSRKRQRTYAGDRFIPNRSGQDLHASYSLLHEDGSPATPSRSAKRMPHNELHFQRTEEANRTYSTLLRSEMFESTVPQTIPQSLSPSNHGTTFHDPTRSHTPPTQSSSLPAATLTPSTPHKNLFSYVSPRHHSNYSGHPTPNRTPSSRSNPNLNARSEIYSLSPVKHSSQMMLLSPRKAPRHVAKVPYKVLDAPDLADDFYLNLVDWGSQNILGVGLNQCVYMWNSSSGRVTKLCELQDDTVTSVNWIQRGSHLAIGTGKGFVQIWDAGSQRRLRTMTGHTARVGALAWNEHILTSGSRDRLIYHRDVREPHQWVRKLVGHKQEVCGLKWNSDDGQLASGGNDNKLMVWEKLNAEPTYKWSEHSAAVKAIAWSPHQRGLLASGGGTADRTIKFWDTLTSSYGASSSNVRSSVTIPHSNSAIPPSSSSSAPANLISSLDTGSQVCNLAWSRNSNEIVSTHGYSQNQIIVWKYPSMTQVASLTGHTYRVLYLAMSPNGEVIVTGAGDETLRFWNAFRKKEKPGTGMGTVDDWGTIR